MSDQEFGKLLDELQSANAYKRKVAAEMLGEVEKSNEAIVRALKGVALNDPNKYVRQAAARSLNMPAHRSYVMVENWRCAKCGSLNPPRRGRCWQCGSDRLTGDDISSQPLQTTPRPLVSQNQGELLGKAEDVAELQVATPPATNQEQPNEPSALVTLLFTMLLIAVLQGGGLLLALFWPGSTGDLQTTALGLSLTARLVIGYVSVSGYKPINAKPFHYVGMMILASLPLLSWISVYYAGKAIARKFTK